jgi:hypothetical protein
MIVVMVVGVTSVNAGAVIPPVNIANVHTPADAAAVIASCADVTYVHTPAGTSKRTAAAAKATAASSHKGYDPAITGIAF